jgi:hypothetical protein
MILQCVRRDVRTSIVLMFLAASTSAAFAQADAQRAPAALRAEIAEPAVRALVSLPTPGPLVIVADTGDTLFVATLARRLDAEVRSSDELYVCDGRRCHMIDEATAVTVDFVLHDADSAHVRLRLRAPSGIERIPIYFRGVEYRLRLVKGVWTVVEDKLLWVS